MKKLYFATWEKFIEKLHRLQQSRFLHDYERREVEDILREAEKVGSTTRQQDNAIQLFSRAAQRRARKEAETEFGKPQESIKIDD